jgi:allene oxide cyclase-like protein
MLKKALFSLGVVAAATVVSATVPASAITRPQVFNLIDVEETSTPLDPGANFNEDALPELGSRFTFTDALYKWAGRKRGARVGRLEGICTFTKIEERVAVTAFCNATWYLPQGQILAAAFLRFAEEASAFRVAVIGGTGAYANARGFIRITDLRSGNSNMEFHLLP